MLCLEIWESKFKKERPHKKLLSSRQMFVFYLISFLSDLFHLLAFDKSFPLRDCHKKDFKKRLSNSIDSGTDGIRLGTPTLFFYSVYITAFLNRNWLKGRSNCNSNPREEISNGSQKKESHYRKNDLFRLPIYWGRDGPRYCTIRDWNWFCFSLSSIQFWFIIGEGTKRHPDSLSCRTRLSLLNEGIEHNETGSLRAKEGDFNKNQKTEQNCSC